MFVYKSYDQPSLDLLFNNRKHVPDYADYLNRWETLSRQTESGLPVKKNLSYGNLRGEILDIYPSPTPGSKTLIFIHGGYWHLLNKELFHFLANGFNSYHVTTVLLTYPMAPAVSINQIVASCKKAVQWLYNNISSFGGDPDQFYVAGHSAGGHLAAMLIATDWKEFDNGFPPNLLKGACFVSGLFDLIPVHLSYLNKELNMDSEAAIRNSPVLLEPAKTCPIVVAVGEEETAMFIDQSNDLFACWKGKGANIQLMQLREQNHYSIVEAITDKSSALHQAVCRLMKLGN